MRVYKIIIYETFEVLFKTSGTSLLVLVDNFEYSITAEQLMTIQEKAYTAKNETFKC